MTRPVQHPASNSEARKKSTHEHTVIEMDVPTLQKIRAEAWQQGFDACQLSRHTARSSDNPHRSEP